jgi:hypothetical protein
MSVRVQAEANQRSFRHATLMIIHHSTPMQTDTGGTRINPAAEVARERQRNNQPNALKQAEHCEIQQNQEPEPRSKSA